MIRIGEIIDTIQGYIPDPDLALIQKAYVFSASAHEGQTRLSGEPYLSHPLSVASILAGMHLDEASIAAGLLHDTVEDTKATIDEIREKFGTEVAHIVDGVTKISKMVFESREEAQAENIRKMIVAMSEDIRVLMVKLADRLHNMRTLDFMKPHKQRMIAQETLDIYAPLANRLGLHPVKVELEDLCFQYLKPDAYKQLKKSVEGHATVGRDYIDKVIGLLKEMIASNKIEGKVTGRTKHFFSIYNKMLQQGLTFDQVYDLIAFRVVVSSLKDCYAVLGLVHATWRPVPGRFKDYISMPKNNMYQSLHTTVVGPDGERIEIQIRTHEMHKLAELGVAAHWQYKESQLGMKSRDMEKFSWLRQILDWQKETKDPRDFMANLRSDLFSDEVYVFTPRGDVKELPEGATPVDFAYLIHSQVGDHCSGAKVNGKLVPLSSKLTNGDTVEVFTDSSRRPSRDWLKFVKTAKAISRIKHFIRTEERERSILLGREMLEKEGRKMGVNFAKVLQSGDLEPIAEEYSFKSVEELLSAVGYSRITPKKLLHRLLPKEPEEEKPAAAEEAPKAAPLPMDKVRIKGVDDVLVRYAQCCDPLPGDPIVGYITRGRGVTVHTADCPNVKNLEPERLLSIAWEGQEDKPYPAKISIKAKNVPGALAQVAEVLAEQGVNIDTGTFISSEDHTSDVILTIEVRDSAHLYATIDRLSSLDKVLGVSRLSLA
ncbi:metal dependent phosphohydrolase [Desulfovibrio sp. X2]|uniref:RelA/SpoT family protein n=1 Tax=Desulfovibrio sp. X2 TaxID=941449 RepID=UPI000358A6FF|nr:bifunctional (p)ppGpp synthetase/guanosine-3',5'-bis(diphosphate) 3'-pyrophosphohydrolase [Desulfovibrio sp. X2]EPR37327.1 metal dependent phosphohydrolase [Desulfovibrio sp. X2]